MVTAFENDLNSKKLTLFGSNDLAIVELKLQEKSAIDEMAPRRNLMLLQRARRVEALHGSASTGVFVYSYNGHVNKKLKQSLLLIPESLF